MNLNNSKIEALELLKELIGDTFYITGSISLNLFKIIEREPKDIDIVVPNTLLYVALKELGKECKVSVVSDDISNMEVKDFVHNSHIDNITQFSFSLNNESFCCFIKQQKLEYLPFKIGQHKYNVLYPYYSIEAKMKYIHHLKQIKNKSEKQELSLSKHTLDSLNFILN